jgi:hypothetical protein
MAPEQFVEAIVEDWAPLPAPAVIMGTSVESGDCHLHQKQLALALQRFGHFSVFCYSSLFSPVSLPGLLSFFFSCNSLIAGVHVHSESYYCSNFLLA